MAHFSISGARHLSKFWARTGAISGKEDTTLEDVLNSWNYFSALFCSAFWFAFTGFYTFFVTSLCQFFQIYQLLVGHFVCSDCCDFSNKEIHSWDNGDPKLRFIVSRTVGNIIAAKPLFSINGYLFPLVSAIYITKSQRSQSVAELFISRLCIGE